jgi:membrane associated rhomboid family serine protease
MALITLMRRWLWRLRIFFYFSPTALILAGVCIFVYIALAISSRIEFAFGYSFADAIRSFFGLNWGLLKAGFFWQPATYVFLHAGFLHLLFNMMALLLFGSGVETEVGSRRFLAIFFIGGIIGGLGWLVLLALLPYLPSMPDTSQWIPHFMRSWMPQSSGRATLAGAMCIGASGAVFSLIGAYAAMFPSRQVIWFMPFPLRISARWLAIVLGVLTVLEAVVIHSQVAYAAHMAGGFAGYLYGFWLNKRGYYGD